MTNERKKLYLFAGINLILGVIIGIVLFCGQIKSNPEVFQKEYYYNTSVELTDVLRVWWENLLWMLSAVLSYSVLRADCVHIIVAIRGCVSSFSIMYILKYLGIKEAVVSALPQCITILPLIIILSVILAEKDYSEKGGFYIKRSRMGLIFLSALASAAAETAVFKGLCLCLF